MTRSSSSRLPSLWQGVSWALERGSGGGGVSRSHLVWRSIVATLRHGKALRRWMLMVHELKARGVVDDIPGEYLRAVRPYVQRHTDVTTRVVGLIDHIDWLETAFAPASLQRLFDGKAVVLAELAAPRGYEFMRLQLRRSSAQSPEGELLLTLSLQRSPDVQRNALPVDAAVLAFSRFRIDGTSCLVIGGVRGQRSPVLRMSEQELKQALQGWKPSVLMVRVAQELARFWGLRLVGLDAAAHPLQGWNYQWSRRHREAAHRIFASYAALWNHFDAKHGPHGWMVLPINSDEKLEAVALSPEKRARQVRRADYWIRMRKLLRTRFGDVLHRAPVEARLSRVTEAFTLQDDDGYQDSEDVVPSRAMDSGPSSLS